MGMYPSVAGADPRHARSVHVILGFNGRKPPLAHQEAAPCAEANQERPRAVSSKNPTFCFPQ